MDTTQDTIMDYTTFIARISARGEDSTVPDNPDAVDAEIYLGSRIDRQELGEVTLLPDERGRLVAWGPSMDMWASAPVFRWLQSLDDNDRHDAISEIEDAVNRAAKTGR